MPVPSNPKPINRLSMREAVYNTLLKWIMEGVLRPGEKIVDKDLAERLGVSRTPVREALRRLEDKELIESSANRWTRVAKVSLQEPDRIYPIIWTLEELVVSQVISTITDADLKQMTSINKMMKKAVSEGNAVRASWADTEFHQVLIDKTENPHLINILRDLKIKFRRVEITYFGGSLYANDSLSEHEQIIAALQQQNLQEAQQLIRQNWQNSLQRLHELDRQETESEN